MVLGSTIIAIMAVALTTIGTIVITNKIVAKSLEEEVTKQLIFQRDSQKDKIETYIQSLENEVQDSASLGVVFSIALMEFKSAFYNFEQQLNDSAKANADSGTVATNTNIKQSVESHSKSVEDYYSKQFFTEFSRRNDQVKPINVADYISKLDTNTLALQKYFIADNPNPLGKKDKLVKPRNINTDYSTIHAKYHSRFKTYQKKWEFYDIFLVDADTGNVIYSVFKEMDYATSLKTGPFAKSGLGQAFRTALKKDMKDKSFKTKMSPYYPSYNDYASFISAPLYIKGQLEGVFIIQMKLDKINAIMTYDKKWKAHGLGDSGETYLVADDFTMRNNSRLLIEDPQVFLSTGRKSGLSQHTLNNISKKGTTVGLQNIKTSGVQEALAGKTGSKIFPDYQGISVLSAYAPINIAGFHWAILAEIEADEAFSPVQDLINKIILTALIIGLVIMALSILFSVFFANTIVNPITHFKKIIEGFKAGQSDLRVNAKEEDEIGDLARDFDQLLDERQATLLQIETENNDLNESVINMLQAASQLSQGDLRVKMPVTEDVTGTLADSLNLIMAKTSQTLGQVKLTANNVEQASNQVKHQSDNILEVSSQESKVIDTTVQELANASTELNRIAELARQCNIAAGETIATTDIAQQTVLATVNGINNLRENISETEKRIKRLGERSQEIAGITGIINSIAERTHILALNATMQATSAGEAGRGFATVATEIQRLAENATDATTEIGILIKNIQLDTADTIKTMNHAITQVVEGSRMAENAGSQMRDTQEKSHHLVTLVQQIADSSDNQVQVSKQLQRQAVELKQSNQETSVLLEEQAERSNNLVNYAKSLLKSISVFKIKT